jgi:hypothetical protein
MGIHVYRLGLGNPKYKHQRLRGRIILKYILEKCFENMIWFELAYCRVHWGTDVSRVTNLQVSMKERYFFIA